MGQGLSETLPANMQHDRRNGQATFDSVVSPLNPEQQAFMLDILVIPKASSGSLTPIGRVQEAGALTVVSLLP